MIQAILISVAQGFLLKALNYGTNWGKKKLNEMWEHAKKRVLELEADTSLTGKQKSAVLSEELRMKALDLSPNATDEAVAAAYSKAAPFLNQAIEILIPFAVIVARAQAK